MNMINMLRLRLVMTCKAIHCFMVLVCLLAMVQASAKGKCHPKPKPHISDSKNGPGHEYFLQSYGLPSKRKTWGWVVGIVASLLALVVLLFLPWIDAERLDYEGISKTMMVTFTVAASALCLTCIGQAIASYKINEEMGTDGNCPSDQTVRKIATWTKWSRNTNFVFAVCVILTAFVLGLYLLGQNHIDDENLLTKTMNTLTCLVLMTSGIIFMACVVPHTDANQAPTWAGATSNCIEKCGDFIKEKCGPKDDEELSFWNFFRSKSFVVAIACILAIVFAATNVFGGEDEVGNSQITKLATLVVGGTILSAICIGAIYRGLKYYSHGNDQTYGEWENNKEKADWVTKTLQGLVLAVVFITAIVLTHEASVLEIFNGNGGQALAVVWVLFAFSIFGSYRLGRSLWDAHSKTSDETGGFAPEPKKKANFDDEEKEETSLVYDDEKESLETIDEEDKNIEFPSEDVGNPEDNFGNDVRRRMLRELYFSK